MSSEASVHTIQPRAAPLISKVTYEEYRAWPLVEPRYELIHGRMYKDRTVKRQVYALHSPLLTGLVIDLDQVFKPL